LIGTEASLAIEAPAADESAALIAGVVVYVFVRKNRDGTVVDYHLDKPSRLLKNYLCGRCSVA